MRTPREIEIEITSRCNLRCKYCSFFDNSIRSYSDLTKEEWLQFIEELGRCGVMRVTIGGGEAFTRQDLLELLSSIIAHRMRFKILSNGGLITDKIASWISGTGRCDQVQISLDGSCSETHDVCRGKGAFEGAVRGIRILQRHDCPVTVRTTIHKNNVDDLPNTARFLLEELGLPGFSVNSAGYMGSCREHSESVLLSTSQREKAMNILLQLSEKYPGRISALAGPLAEGKRWTEMERIRRGETPPPAEGGRLTGCGCVFSKLSVRADGVMVPCLLLPHLMLGQVNQDNLATVWQTSPILESLRSRKEKRLDTFEFCADCNYIDSCTGNCPALAYNILGKVDHPSPDACLKRYLAAGGRLPDKCQDWKPADE